MNADVEAVERIWRSSPRSPTPAANETGVTVTCLMPGATDTRFFARAGMLRPRGPTKKSGKIVTTLMVSISRSGPRADRS